MVNELAQVLLSTFGIEHPSVSDFEEFIALTRLSEHKPETIYLAYVTHPMWQPFLRSLLTGEDRLGFADFLKRMEKESIIKQHEALHGP
jgi:hypothetical protein